jgi:hypothetical protein
MYGDGGQPEPRTAGPICMHERDESCLSMRFTSCVVAVIEIARKNWKLSHYAWANCLLSRNCLRLLFENNAETCST